MSKKSKKVVSNVNIDPAVYDHLEAVYDRLCIIRDDLCTMVRQELEEGIVEDYSSTITDAIVDDVAQGMLEVADPKDWNNCDVRLEIGRVLCKRLGVDV